MAFKETALLEHGIWKMKVHIVLMNTTYIITSSFVVVVNSEL